MWRLFLALLVAAPLAAQPIRQEKSLKVYEPQKVAPTKAATGRVRLLIGQLAAVDPDKHASAERELLSLCSAIEPQLRYALAQEEKAAPAPLPKSVPMRQEYVRGGGFMRFQPADLLPRGAYHSLYALIEHCEELRHTKPALITLNANDAPLPDIFRQLGQQADAGVTAMARSFDGAVDPAGLDWFQNARATVRLDRVPYWMALRTILAAIHPPSLSSVELFVEIGGNQVRLFPLSPNFPDLFRNTDGFVAGPLLLSAEYQASPKSQIVVSAVLDPALNGFTGDSSLHLEAVTDDKGDSLLLQGDNRSSSSGLEDQDFNPSSGYAFDPADGQFSWRRLMSIKAPDPGRSVAAARGTFGIGFGAAEGSHDSLGSTHTIGIPLASFHPETLASQTEPLASQVGEEQVYVLQDCKVLQPLSVDKPVYQRDKLDCHARGLERSRGPANRDTTEGVELTLTNHRDHPVTYVAGLTYFVDPVPDWPKPDQIVGSVGIYHAHAEPGQTVRIRMATHYRAGTRAPVAQVPDRLPQQPGVVAPRVAVYDGWRLSVGSVTRNGEAYEISGQLTLPVAGPFGDAAVGAGYIFLNPVDAQGWQIEANPHFSKLRQEGDHLVEDFHVVTREPGRVPAALVWQAPEATHWLTTSFHTNRLGEVH